MGVITWPWPQTPAWCPAGLGAGFPKTAPYGTSMWRFCSAIHGSANFWKALPALLFEPSSTTNPALKLFRWTSSTQGHRRNQSVFDTVLGRTSMGRKAFTARQHRSHTAHAVSAFRSKTDQGRSFLKIVYTQRGTEPGGTAGGQHMVRARAVVAQSLGSVAAHKNSPGMADIIQHRLRVFYRQLQVFRSNAVGHLSRFF